MKKCLFNFLRRCILHFTDCIANSKLYSPVLQNSRFWQLYAAVCIVHRNCRVIEVEGAYANSDILTHLLNDRLQLLQDSLFETALLTKITRIVRCSLLSTWSSTNDRNVAIVNNVG